MLCHEEMHFLWAKISLFCENAAGNTILGTCSEQLGTHSPLIHIYIFIYDTEKCV